MTSFGGIAKIVRVLIDGMGGRERYREKRDKCF
jgi:hypothetical protein